MKDAIIGLLGKSFKVQQVLKQSALRKFEVPVAKINTNRGQTYSLRTIHQGKMRSE